MFSKNPESISSDICEGQRNFSCLKEPSDPRGVGAMVMVDWWVRPCQPQLH